jgi:hypothetical protein
LTDSWRGSRVSLVHTEHRSRTQERDMPRTKVTEGTTSTGTEATEAKAPVAPEMVMAEVEDFPAGGTRGGGRSDKWTQALAKIAAESPGKVILLAKFRGGSGAINTSLAIRGGGKVKGEVQADQYPEGTSKANWEVVARKLEPTNELANGGEFKSALYVRYNANPEVAAA